MKKKAKVKKVRIKKVEKLAENVHALELEVVVEAGPLDLPPEPIPHDIELTAEAPEKQENSWIKFLKSIW